MSNIVLDEFNRFFETKYGILTYLHKPTLMKMTHGQEF